MIYGIWALLCMAGLTVFHAVRVALAALAGVPDRVGGIYDRAPRAWARQLIRWTRLPVETRGLERLDPAQPYVYAANHASFLDTWLLVAFLPGSVRFIVKRELLRVPFFGPGLRLTGQIALERGDKESAAQAYEAGFRRLAEGRSLIVFVEGTRSRTGRLGEFKKDAFVLAIGAGVPLVPVYLSRTHRALPSGSLWLRRRPVGLIVGEPIPTAGLVPEDRERLQERCRAWMLAQEAAVDALPAAG